MATDMERLIVSLEARTKAFENSLNKANATAQKNLKAIEKRFIETNKAAILAAPKAARAAGIGVGIGAGGVFAAVASANEVRKYADAWTEAGNKIAAASAISGRQARSLREVNDIADKTRTGITETVDLYAKLLRSTADVAKSEEEIARATEIVNKAFKAGGAATSEQIAGILQLSQALGSGILQGDELRSLRENAPLLAQAIADEFGTTIAGLKQLGAEGAITSDRVFKAILAAQPKIDKAFATTTATIGDGITLLQNAATETIGRIDAVSGASGKLGERLSELAITVNQVGDVFEDVAGRPAGKFLGFISEAISRLEPLNNALRTLSGKGNVGSDIVLGATDLMRGSDLAAQIESAKKELDKLFSRPAMRAATPEQMKSLEALREKLREGRIGADEAKAAIAAIAEENAGLSDLPRLFDPLIDKLTEVKKAASEAANAVTLAEGGRAAGFRMQSGDRFYSEGGRAAGFAMQSDPEANFINARNAAARRTELERQIDTRALEILKAADEIGVSMSQAAAKIQAKSELANEEAAKASAAAVSSAVDLIKKREGFISNAEWDVNAFRVGYGSDTMTSESGAVSKVTADSVTTLAAANRDLARRISEFQNGIRGDIGGDTFDSLSENQQAALTSIAYNYGSLPDRIIAAIKGGDTVGVYNAIKGLGGDNGGINRDRRNEEAELFLNDAPSSIQKSIQGAESFEANIKAFKQQIEFLKEETGLRQSLNPLVDDYGRGLSTLRAAQELLTMAQEEGTAAGRELSSTQQLLHGDLSNLSPAAREQALAMRELALASGEAEAAGEQLKVSQEDLSDSLNEAKELGKDVLGGFIRDLVDGKSASEALANALGKVADKLLDMALNSAFDAVFGGKSAGGGLGGLIGSFLGFDDGGYTGPGPRKKPAGVVHKGEVVWSQDDIRRAGGVGRVEAWRRRGYEVGGIVGGTPLIPRSITAPSIPKAANDNRPQNVTFRIDVDGASGDDHIVKLVRQGVQAGLGRYDRELNDSFGQRMAMAHLRQL